MKRILLYAAAILATSSILASCEQFSGGRRSIGFSPASGAPATKATAVTTDNIATLYGKFCTQAYLTDSGELYYDKSVTTYTKDGVWSTGRFWPEDYDTALDFWSYGPVEAFDGSTIETYSLNGDTPDLTGHDYFNFDYKPATDAADQKDVIVAYTSNRKYNDASSHLVPVDFKHVLSGVKFKLDVDGSSAKNVEITNVHLSNVDGWGACSVMSPLDCKCAWATSTSHETHPFPTTYVQKMDDMLMIVPQTFDGVTATIDWKMDGEQYDSRTASVKNVTLNPGVIYTFTITVSTRTKTMDVELTDWTPWDYVDNTLDFSDNVVAATKTIEYSNCVIDEETKRITFLEGNQPIKCLFKIDSPLGATFFVSLQKDFDAFQVEYTSSRVIVNEDSYYCEFEITPTIANPERDYETSLKISARTVDGRVINVDNVVQPEGSQYTIVLPKNN